VEENIVVYCRH